MSTIPTLIFLISGLVMVYCQRAYYARLESFVGPLRPGLEWAEEIRQKPSRLIPVVAAQTRARLAALATRQQSPQLERRRRIALLSILPTLACYLWVTFFS
jgi:hypothetical protein